MTGAYQRYATSRGRSLTAQCTLYLCVVYIVKLAQRTTRTDKYTIFQFMRCLSNNNNNNNVTYKAQILTGSKCDMSRVTVKQKCFLSIAS